MSAANVALEGAELQLALGGLLVRAGRRLGRGPFLEPAEVWWMSVGERFADLRSSAEGCRSPLDRSQAFGGVVEIEGDRVRWRHDFDTTTRPPGHLDEARFFRRGGALVEVGEDYEEHWVRATPLGAPGRVAELESAPDHGPVRLFVVADRALALFGGDAPGGARLVRRGRFAISSLLSSPPEGVDLPAAADALATERAPTGWRIVA